MGQFTYCVPAYVPAYEVATFVAPKVGGAGVKYLLFPPTPRTRTRRAVRVTTSVAAPPLHGASASALECCETAHISYEL